MIIESIILPMIKPEKTLFACDATLIIFAQVDFLVIDTIDFFICARSVSLLHSIYIDTIKPSAKSFRNESTPHAPETMSSRTGCIFVKITDASFVKPSIFSFADLTRLG